MRRSLTILYAEIVLSLVVIMQLSCTKQDIMSFNKDLSLFAFVISDNDLDDYSEFIEQDMVKGLKGCLVGTELFLYLDRQKKRRY